MIFLSIVQYCTVLYSIHNIVQYCTILVTIQNILLLCIVLDIVQYCAHIAQYCVVLVELGLRRRDPAAALSPNGATVVAI